MPGFPPPPNFPAPPAPPGIPAVPGVPAVPSALSPSASLAAKFATPKINATVCGITIALPSFVLGFSLSFSIDILLPKLPKLNLHFKLSCDLNNPIDVSAGIEPGGGRLSVGLPDPDLNEDFSTY